MTVSPQTETVKPRWNGLAFVAATGPSLTADVAEQIRGHNIIAVSDAYKLLPFAPVMYSCDAQWWKHHDGCRDFAGEKWSSHSVGGNDKSRASAKYGLRLVAGTSGNGFSTKPNLIHYGRNSGFQAVNLAILFGATRIALVGFDMRIVNGKHHFFGSHPSPLMRCVRFKGFIESFGIAAKNMPPGVEIINCTRGSDLKCFQFRELNEVLDGLEASNAA